MSDYIEREAAVKAIDEHLSYMLDGAEISAPSKELYGLYGLSHTHCKSVINRLPSAQVREVVQGRWYIKAYGCYCSVCGTGSNMPYWNFCPNCGADMRGPVANIDVVGRKEKGDPT